MHTGSGLGFDFQSALSSAGAATAKVTKARARKIVDLKNCIFVSEVGGGLEEE